MTLSKEEFKELKEMLSDLAFHLDKTDELYWGVWRNVIRLIPKEEVPKKEDDPNTPQDAPY